MKKLKKRHQASILFYHRFSSKSPEVYQLPHLDIHEFKKQIHHIKKYYNVISMDEIANSLAEKDDFSIPSIAVTIDDGYLNNYTLAYPVLKIFKIPLTIYLATSFIGTKKSLWVDDLLEMLLATDKKEILFPEIFGNKLLDISSVQKKRSAVSKLFKALQYISHENKVKALNRLPEILALKDDYPNTDRKMLNWDEVIEMAKNDICFGAHTVTHPTLSKMDLVDAKQEINDSIKEIEKKIGKKVSHFAIPNGKNEDFSEDLKQYCKGLGLLTVVSTEPGLVCVQSDPYFLKRILPPPPMYVFACQLAIYMFFKKS